MRYFVLVVISCIANNLFCQSINILEPQRQYFLRQTENFNIKWQAQSLDTISIFYRTGPSLPWDTVALSVTGTSYLWEVPATPCFEGELKVESKEYPAIFDTVDSLKISQLPPSPPFDTTWKEKLYYKDKYPSQGPYKLRQLVNQIGTDMWTVRITEVKWDYSITEYYENWYIISGRYLYSPEAGRNYWIDLQQRKDSVVNTYNIKITNLITEEDAYYFGLKEVHNRNDYAYSAFPYPMSNAVYGVFVVGRGPAYLFNGRSDGYLLNEKKEEVLLVPVPLQYGTMVSPSGGETLISGRQINVSWEGQATLGIYPLFSSDGGDTWKKISGFLDPGINSCLWNVPQINSDQCLMMIKTADGEHLNTSGVFAVKPDSTTSITDTYIPSEFKVFQNFPNPFNSSTIIRYSVKENNSLVIIKLYDLLGREVTEFVHETKDKGIHTFSFNAEGLNLPSGTYICNVRADENSAFIKMLLLK
jgi:hypothetical protein